MKLKEISSINNLEKHHDFPCVSIILPTHRTSPDRQVDQPKFKQAIKEVVRQIKINYPDHLKNISEKLDVIIEEIDFLHNDLGLGIFVSPDYARWFRFSFRVEERIFVGDNFRLRELLYHQKINPHYYYLSINSKKIRLFSGEGQRLNEINDELFPYLAEDDYLYEKPARGNSFGNSLKNPEKDKSVLQEIRLTAHLKKVDSFMKKYLNNREPLFISGVKKETGYFLKITANKKSLAGIIHGNFSEGNDKVSSSLVYDEVLAWQNMKENEMLDELSDAFGKRQVASGMEEVWHAAKNGMGLSLFVEKDFNCSGYVSGSNGFFSRLQPDGNFREISDAVDYLIAIVLSKNGTIHIVGNNKLTEHDRIALRLRYRRSES